MKSKKLKNIPATDKLEDNKYNPAFIRRFKKKREKGMEENIRYLKGMIREKLQVIGRSENEGTQKEEEWVLGDIIAWRQLHKFKKP